MTQDAPLTHNHNSQWVMNFKIVNLPIHWSNDKQTIDDTATTIFHILSSLHANEKQQQ